MKQSSQAVGLEWTVGRAEAVGLLVKPLLQVSIRHATVHLALSVQMLLFSLQQRPAVDRRQGRSDAGRPLAHGSALGAAQAIATNRATTSLGEQPTFQTTAVKGVWPHARLHTGQVEDIILRLHVHHANGTFSLIQEELQHL